MKKTLSLYLLLALAVQPLVGMQTPQPNITGKAIAAAIGATGLVAAVITYLLLAKSDKQVCDEFRKKVATAVNKGKITPIEDRKITIRPLFSSEPEHGVRLVSRKEQWNECWTTNWIVSQNGCRAHAYHTISTRGPFRFHLLQAEPKRNSHHQFNREAHTLLMVARDHREREPLEVKE